MNPCYAIDLFCGLGGWAEGLLAEGWDVIGYDIEAHEYGDLKYPSKLVLQDVLTIHGSQFKDANLIVASPPCQEYSYMAMPWSKAKAIAADYRSGKRDVKKLTALFDACFRIQREACEAAGRYIPMVVENVRGAQPWVGRARWNFGSYYLWGDVPALMPIACRSNSQKLPEGNTTSTMWSERPIQRLCDAYKSQVMNWSDQTKRGQDFTRITGEQCGFKQGGDWFNQSSGKSISRTTGSKSKARKAASAMIAKIPFPLARHIAWAWKPKNPFDKAGGVGGFT